MKLESKFGFDKVRIRDSNLTGRIQEIIVREDGGCCYRVATWIMGVELRHFIVAEWELSLVEGNDAEK